MRTLRDRHPLDRVPPGLVRELCKLPRETEWAELKRNNDDPQDIGEYISALANAAALSGKTTGYLLWGVGDEDHGLLGTRFDPASARKGSEELESWLLRLSDPHIDFKFTPVELDGQRVVLLEVRGHPPTGAFLGRRIHSRW